MMNEPKTHGSMGVSELTERKSELILHAYQPFSNILPGLKQSFSKKTSCKTEETFYGN